MAGKIKAIRGFRDIDQYEAHRLSEIERIARGHFQSYGYHEIRLPVVEATELFARSIGESTDIVEKEMYTFTDRKGKSITLRPEGTASAVRAYLEGGWKSRGGLSKLYYSGPMFRYEKPQKGRYRQFYQLGLEALGSKGPLVDAEVINLLHGLFGLLGIADTRMLVNSLGCESCRPDFRKDLVSFLEEQGDLLCADCQRRMKTNPLRVLDCKVSVCREALDKAPVMIQHLCSDCSGHFRMVREGLDGLEVPYEVDPKIVRGLDYYNRTAFEAVCDRLGSQNAVAAGGRYDGLAREIGGDVPGIGFAIGLERLNHLVDWPDSELPVADYYVASATSGARVAAMSLADRLRDCGCTVESDLEDRSLKAQLRNANRLGVESVIILGDEEMSRGVVKVKDFRNNTQEEIPVDKLLKDAGRGCMDSKGEE